MDFIQVHGTRIIKTLSDGSSQTIRGQLDRIDTNVAEGMLHVNFRVQMWMSAAKMDILLPCMGFAESPTDTFILGDSLPSCKVIIGPGGAPEVTYDGAYVTDWVVVGRKGSNPIMIDIGFVGKTRVEAAAGTFFVSKSSPALVEGYTYAYPDGTYTVTSYTVLGAARYFPMFQLSENNGVITEFNQSVNATHNCPTDHDLTFGTSVLYSTCDSSTDLVTTPMAGDTSGGPLVIDLERTVGVTTYRTQFSVANAKLLARDGDIRKADFNRVPIMARGFATSSTPMLTVLNTST